MAKVAFVLNPKPTFDAKVALPVHGSNTVDVGFTFKHKSRAEVADLLGDNAPTNDVDLLLEICAGWELDDEFNKDNAELLAQNYIGAIPAIWSRYLELIAQKREGN